jgi:hypothetical protein
MLFGYRQGDPADETKLKQPGSKFQERKVTSSESLHASCALLTSMSVPMSRPRETKYVEVRTFMKCNK